MKDCLVIQDTPDLVDPYMFIGLSGWLNAGEVSTGSVDYLRRKLKARPLAQIESRGFYINQIPGAGPEQMMRPHTVIDEGLIRGLDLPKNEFFHCKSENGRDLILLSGIEPNLEWPDYAEAVLEVVRRFQVTKILSLGSVFDQVPHTRETRFFAVLSRPELKEMFLSVPLLTYSGPCSFSTLLLFTAGSRGIDAAGISARIPPYIQNFNAKAGYDLLKKVISLTSLEVDLGDLKSAGNALIESMNRAFGQNETALEQLKRLEDLYDAALLQEIHQAPGGDYDKLLQEMLTMKRDGRKPH